jgi:hypothetical protein
MVQYTDSKLVISIITETPLEQLLIFKKSLIRVLQSVNPDTVESNSGLIYDIQNVMDIVAALEFESEQMQQITLALTGYKPKNEHLLVA